MITPKDSAWIPHKRQLVCKLCGGTKSIEGARLGDLQQMLALFKNFEARHVCIKAKEVEKNDRRQQANA